jgi:hypothetical protein
MKKKPENLSDPRVLLTEAGEEQWLNQMLDEAAAQLQRDKKHPAAADDTHSSETTERPRKAA